MSENANVLGFDGEDVLKSSNLDRVTTVERLASRDWSRDNIGERFREVRNNRDTIQSIIQDLTEDFQNIPSEEELDNQWGAFLEQKGVDADNKSPNDAVPAAYFLMTQRKVDALIRISVWQARLEELEYFALKKFNSVFEQLLEEYRLAKSYDTIQDALDDKSEKWVLELVEDKIQKIDAKISEFEKFEQARLEERKADRELFRQLASQANGVDEEQVLDVIRDAADGLGDHLTDQGVLELNPDKIESVRDRRERDSAAESNAEKEVVEDDEEDGEPDIENPRQELIDNWEDQYEMRKQEDIAEMLGKSQSWISKVKKQENLG